MNPRERYAAHARFVSVAAFAWVAWVSVASRAAAQVGPDVVVSDVVGVYGWGTETTCHDSGTVCLDAGDCPPGEACDVEITAFSIGTAACNVGDEPANWCDVNSGYCLQNEHPVIAQNMYRLSGGRFEQIGMSWVKHGFAAFDGDGCGMGCLDTNTSDLLGVGCWDIYGAQLNGLQWYLGPRSEVNAATGSFPFPYQLHGGEMGDTLFKRLQVYTVDIDPALNVGALYYAEGHYVTPDDALAGNGDNNASHHEITIIPPGGLAPYTASLVGNTIEGEPAIHAWKTVDPAVMETAVNVPADGRYILSGTATARGDGYWHYEYALFNLNSDRSAGSFSIPLPLGAIVENAGFHDVDYHTDEPYDGTDWPVTVTNAAMTWSTDPFSADQNANALRFSTLYNFRFDVNVEPDGGGSATIGLFKPGTPADVVVATIAPLLALIDCNRNGEADSDDITGGFSTDCDSNGVPDECQADCQPNGIADTCDLSGGTSTDCNGNTIPDECDADCDGNGTPDDCEPFDDCNANGIPDTCDPDCNGNGLVDECEADPDTDGDGIDDCFDLCPLTSPPGACECPPVVCCCPPGEPMDPCVGLCIDGLFSWELCLDAGWVPSCQPSYLCHDGCLIGDANDDGLLDLRDVTTLMNCFTGPIDGPGFVPPTAECATSADDDADGDVDLADYRAWWTATNP